MSLLSEQSSVQGALQMFNGKDETDKVTDFHPKAMPKNLGVSANTFIIRREYNLQIIM